MIRRTLTGQIKVKVKKFLFHFCKEEKHFLTFNILNLNNLLLGQLSRRLIIKAKAGNLRSSVAFSGASSNYFFPKSRECLHTILEIL